VPSGAIACARATRNTGTYLELAAPGGDTSRGGTEAGILQQTYDLDQVETFLLGPARFRAPRFDVFTYQFFQGTSMAAPHVSGFAALLMQQGITSPAAIEAIMKRYATDLGAPGRDDEYGYGLINPRAALRGMGLVK
jgi:serine protease